jgi:hypothetical protein
MVKTAPGHRDLQGATPIQLQDIQPGDRVLVRGKLADDGKSILTTSAVVMKRADIAQKQQQEREDWNKRGIAGVVKSVDPAAGIIVISSGAMAQKTVDVHVSPGTILRRYAPDSVKFDDARPAPISEIKPGDQLRARGAQAAGQSSFAADEIVSGTFRNIAGTVVSTNSGDNTIIVTDLQTKKPVTVKIGSDSQLRKLPPMMAERIAARLKGPAPSAGAAPNGSASAQAAQPSPQHEGPPAGEAANHGGAFHNGPPDFQQILSRMPAVTLPELQKGDAVMIVATEGSPATPPTAITLLSGVESILSASPGDSRAAMTLSPWSLGMPSGDTAP